MADAQGAAGLILGYVEARAEQQNAASDQTPLIAQLLRRLQEVEGRLSGLETTEKRASELQQTVDVLTKDNEQLRETIRRLEIGFRRHVSEVVSPNQLKLALSPQATPSPAAASTPDTDPSESLTATTHDESQGEGDSEPPPSSKQKNRNQHGRRRVSVIPKVVINILPAKVRLEGLENFDRIGEEDSSMLGYRRGGPVELVFRRLKFVPRAAATSKSSPETRDTESETSQSKTPTDDSDGAVAVLEHEIAAVPADTAFKTSPFVDGAIVRYYPQVSDEGSDDAVIIAPLAERPIERGLVDASLLAHLLVGKLDYHMPYYRQEVASSRSGYPISRTNMARWQFEAGNIARPIAEAMWHEALDRSWIGMDATGTAIQDKPEYRYGHVFVLVAPGDSVLFRYTTKYDGATVSELFGGFTGTIVADASANHNVLFGPGKATEGGCWAHARKPFVKALRAGEGHDAAFALKTIQDLFRIEQQIALASPEERLAVRQQQSRLLVDALFKWVEERLPQVRDDDTFVRKGLVYLDHQQTALRAFLSNGEIPIHNNASERALRRVVKGRMNWLSHGSDDHAHAAYALSSLIATCQLHGLDPELYLQEVLTVAPSWPVNNVLALSPKNWLATRQRLIAEGRLTYLDLAKISGSRLSLRPK